MAQSDQSVQNATFPIVRADINDNLAALFSANSGNTAPSVTVAFQDWIDTSGANPLWKKRNAANNAWITLGTISASAIAFEGTLPSQSGNAGEYLSTDGTVASWGAIPPGSSKETFTTSGTYVKPSAGTVALVTIWGGGGGGGRFQGGQSTGGGGGACVQVLYELSALPASISITIGAGGTGATGNATGGNGGNTSFGALLTAYGGAGGGSNASLDPTNGGGGGGSLAAGSSSSGGAGHSPVLTGGAKNIKADWGGAGGGNGGGSPTAGASAFWGGGGGGGANGNPTTFAGGISLHGGNGATSNTGNAGSVGGGGGGGASQVGTNGGAGGAGYCIIYVW